MIKGLVEGLRDEFAKAQVERQASFDSSLAALVSFVEELISAWPPSARDQYVLILSLYEGGIWLVVWRASHPDEALRFVRKTADGSWRESLGSRAAEDSSQPEFLDWLMARGFQLGEMWPYQEVRGFDHGYLHRVF